MQTYYLENSNVQLVITVAINYIPSSSFLLLRQKNWLCLSFFPSLYLILYTTHYHIFSSCGILHSESSNHEFISQKYKQVFTKEITLFRMLEQSKHVQIILSILKTCSKSDLFNFVLQQQGKCTCTQQSHKEMEFYLMCW